MEESNNLHEILKPFYQRASEAEDRLARLEASVGTKRSSEDEADIVEQAKAEQAAEREKDLKEAQQLAAENAKLQYRITHLVRALKEADSKLASK